MTFCESLNIIVDAVIGSNVPITIADWGLCFVVFEGILWLGFDGATGIVFWDGDESFCVLFGAKFWVWWEPGVVEWALPVGGRELLLER